MPLWADLKHSAKGQIMQDIYKNPLLLEAIKRAIVAFGDRNGLNGMDYFAERLGFNGKNRAIQLHNRLSLTNQEKYIKLEELTAIMDEMDQEEQKIILEAFANKYGFFVKEKDEAPKVVGATLETVVTMSTFDMAGTFGVINDDVFEAIKDGKVDKKEARRIHKGLRELNAKLRGFEDAIIDYLGE